MTYKNPRSMSIEELKQAANNEAVAYYRQQMELDPLNPQAKAEYEQACYRANTRPDPEMNRLQSLTTEQLATEWTATGQAAEAASLEQYRTREAKQWMASQSRYTPTPQSAEKLIAKLNSMGFRGSVYELDAAFNALVDAGELEAPPVPLKLYRDEELRNMPLADIKAYYEKRGM